jgi:hypothetical protein
MTKKYLGLTLRIQEVQLNAVHHLTSCRPAASFEWDPVSTSPSQRPAKHLIVIVVVVVVIIKIIIIS